jgi:hypothetical protein
MRGTFRIALAVVACLVLGLTTIAYAGKSITAKTKVTLKESSSGNPPYNQTTFTGSVKVSVGKGKTSPSKVCKAGRKVSIPGIGGGKTNKKGKFNISVSNPPRGTYQATVKKKTKKVHGTKYVCKKAKSNKVTVS